MYNNAADARVRNLKALGKLISRKFCQSNKLQASGNNQKLELISIKEKLNSSYIGNKLDYFINYSCVHLDVN